uniref:Putative serine/threonine-protein kinase, active site protein n=1 Tax=Helianthus annuus TaxID=4232 RepID=A0A251SY18_HELAN
MSHTMQATLKDGNTVAIKKTIMASSRGKTHFDDELKIICNVHHRHLIRILGYCNKGPSLFPVHEYMDNGSLDQFLYGDKSMNLNWRQRFEIIYGTARGLAYLHEQYHVTIIHRDIKTRNILLDNEFQPKIAEFGLLRLLAEDKTHHSTKLAESMDSCYVAPEYAIHGQLSVKVDTYSFGIVVLEIISGKRCHNVKGDESVGQSLLDHAWDLYDSNTHSILVDERLDPSEYAIEDVKKIIEIALMCTQSPVSARPAMSEVVSLLSDKSLYEMPVRSTFHEEDIKIKVDTLASVSSNATNSSIQLTGR